MVAPPEHLAPAALGNQGLVASRVGLGCLGMTSWYGERDDAESERTLRRAVEIGVRLFDTADSYGPYVNEEFVGSVLSEVPGDYIVATKVGTLRRADGTRIGVDGSPAYIRAAVDGCLSRLRREAVGLLYLHRVDPKVPVEESVGAMADLVHAGKAAGIGLCEVDVDTIRRAHGTFPLSAVQSEYSLWCREPESEVLPVTQQLGIGFVSYSPLGRGLITGTLRDIDQLPPGDERRLRYPWFQEGNFDRNLDTVDALGALARDKGINLSQLALAWGLAKWPHLVVLPGTKRRRYLEDNCAAAHVQLTAADVASIEEVLVIHPPSGARKDEDGMARLRATAGQ